MSTPPRTWRVRRRPVLALSALAVSATLIAAGCGGDDDPSGAPAGATAGFVPASAPVYLEIDADTTSEQWQAASALGEKFPDWPGGSVDEILADALEDADVDYEAEVKPVVGETIALAVPTLDTGGVDDVLGGATDPGSLGDVAEDQDRFILVAQIDDEEGARALLEKEAGSPAGEHGGVDYYVNDDDYAAVWDGAMVFTAEEEDLFASIDAHAAGGEAVLSGQEKFNQTLEELSPEVIGQFYVDIGSVVREAADSQAQLSQLGVDQIANAAFGASITAEEDGFRMRGAVVGAVIEDQPTFDPTLTENAPADTLFYYGFADLATQVRTTLDQVLEASENGDETRQQLEGFSAQLQSLLGISLDDLIALASGEHALVVTPGGASLDIPVTGALVLKVEDGARAESTLDALRNGLPAVLSTLGGGTAPEWRQVPVAPGITGWQLPLDGDSSLVYAVDGDLAVVGLSPRAVAQVLAPQQPLASNEEFSAAIAGAPSPLAGLAWLDIEGAVDLAEQSGAFADDPSQREAVRPLKNLVFWTAGGDTPTFEAFLRIE
jgi:ABC-type phosphate/phosphonate transport system substrate-binding protein